MMARAFSTASTEEIDVELTVIEGSVPSDMYGFVFINSACGTVNSKGLPYEEYLPDGSFNEEFGSPLINGDGVVIRFDLNETEKIKVSTGLMKPPCYYADVATSSPESTYGDDFKFRNIGLGRRSLRLGTRNQLSTAVMPIRFKSEGTTRLLATFDAGRPFEFDPKTFKIITPIGKSDTWRSFLPFFMNTPFNTVMSTAHPVFDPDTEELFTVNFGKSKKEEWMDKLLFEIYIRHERHLRDFLGRLSDKFNLNAQGSDLENERSRALTAIENFVFSEHLRSLPVFSRISERIREFINRLTGRFLLSNNGVFLMKWTGQDTLDQWEVVDEDGKSINLAHNMHQIGFSKNYILLCDTNFKFTFDTMLNFPFQNDPRIGPMIRKLMCKPMNDFSTLYIVKRSDLNNLENSKKVKAKRLKMEHETVHFSVDYDDTDDVVTIHSAHNCSACVADWLRSYDNWATDPDKEMRPDKLGLLAVGEMDIGRVGRLRIDAAKGELIHGQSEFKYFDGMENGNITKAHTWGIGLYTHRDMLSHETNIAKITHIYWQSYGLKEEHLSKFIFEMYSDPLRNNKQFSPAEMLELTKKGAPPVLQCVNTESMISEDFFAFGEEQYMWSLQFVPRLNGNSETPGKDGYILTTTINGKIDEDTGVIEYSPEIWIFDAENLKKGPVVKLSHPDFSFGFTIHSVWVKEAESVPVPDYAFSIKDDLNPSIQKIINRNLREKMQELFDQKVYPNFDLF